MTQCLQTNQLAIGHSPQYRVVCNINLTIRTGEIWCILGANGSGKSTLLRTLAGIIKPLAGTVLLDGHHICNIPDKQKSKHIAFVAQHKSSPLEFTIEELFNLYNPNTPGYFESKPNNIINNANTTNSKTILHTMGLDCDLHTPFHQLSGGQQHILRLALGIIQDSHFLILDEPTASLDLAHAQIITTQIQNITKKNKGIILSTHDPQLALNLNANVLMLHNGKIFAQGRADYIFNETILSTVYNTKIMCLNTEYGFWIKPNNQSC